MILMFALVSQAAMAAPNCIERVIEIQAHSGWTTVVGSDGKTIDITEMSEVEKSSSGNGLIVA
jgi:hypothetical protein